MIYFNDIVRLLDEEKIKLIDSFCLMQEVLTILALDFEFSSAEQWGLSTKCVIGILPCEKSTKKLNGENLGKKNIKINYLSAQAASVNEKHSIEG